MKMEEMTREDLAKEVNRLRSANHRLDNENRDLVAERSKLQERVEELVKKGKLLEGRMADRESEQRALRVGLVSLHANLLLLESGLQSLDVLISAMKIPKALKTRLQAAVGGLQMSIREAHKAGNYDYAARAKEQLFVKLWAESLVPTPDVDRIMHYAEEYIIDPDLRAEIRELLKKKR